MKNLYLFALFMMSCLWFSEVNAQNYNMKLLGIWTDSTIPTNAGGYTFNEVFGFEMNGKEYAVIGSTQGTHIIDITNPSSMVEIDFVPGKYRGNVTHRDFDVHNGHLYMVCDQASSSLQIADLSYLPDSVHVVYDKTTLLVRSHNIFIDSANDILYSCGGSKLSGSNELRMIDIKNPANPSLITDLADDVTWWSSFVGYVHDIYVRNNIAYTNDADAMHIIDLSDPAAPVILGTLTSYSDKGYNHSGYLAADDTTYVMCDETHGKRTKFMDVANPATILVTDIEGPGLPNPTSIPHNPIIKDNYAYLSYYYDGVQVYNIEDKYNVKNVAYYDTYQGANAAGGEGCWGVYPLLTSGKILGSDRRRGLFVLQHLTPPSISFDTSSTTYFEYDGLQTVYVRLSNELDDTVRVKVNIDPTSTATLNSDYTLSSVFPKELIFEPGTTVDSVQFSLIDNPDIESLETLIFTLSSPINGEIVSPSQDTIFIMDNEVVGLDEETIKTIEMYPNPTLKGQLVQFTEKVSYKVMDITGKVIMENYSSSIPTQGLSKGSYLIQFDGKVEKLIVN